MLSYTELIHKLIMEYKDLSDADRAAAMTYAETLKSKHSQVATSDPLPADLPQDVQKR